MGNKTLRKLRPSSGSLTVAIPSEFKQALGLDKNSFVSLELVGDAIILKKSKGEIWYSQK